MRVSPDYDLIVIGAGHAGCEAALAAARKCKFIPGKQRNIPVKAWMALPFNFRLN